MDLAAMKLAIHERCLEVIGERISLLEKELAQVNEAASRETKSSAGDKHETARAMMHIEREKLSRQLTNNLVLKEQLLQLKPDNTLKKVSKGALVQTGSLLVYISTGLGKINLLEREIVAVSPNSPIAVALIGKTSGSEITFRNKAYQILRVA